MTTMVAHVGEPVNLLVEAGRPARFYWHGDRWLVSSSTADAFEFLGETTYVTGWHVSAQVADGSDAADFELARDLAAGGWILDSVAYA